MMTTPYLGWAAAAVLMLAAAPALAKDGTHSSSEAVRSSQSLPRPTTDNAERAHRADVEKVAKEAEADSPPYCSGNKNGLYSGEGYQHGNGKPFSCGKSPG